MTTKTTTTKPLPSAALLRCAGSLLLLLLLVLAPATAAAQNPPMDFSDADEQLLTWPFNVVEYFVEDDGMNVFQHSRVSESPEEIYDTLLSMKREREQVDGFAIVGAGKLSEPRSYTFTLNTNNTRYQVTVRPDAAGAEIIVKTTPSAIRSGYFKRALYPYRLGDNLTVRCERFDHLDE